METKMYFGVAITVEHDDDDAGQRMADALKEQLEQSITLEDNIDGAHVVSVEVE